jgi:hypothetical protein
VSWEDAAQIFSTQQQQHWQWLAARSLAICFILLATKHLYLFLVSRKDILMKSQGFSQREIEI